MRNLLKLILLVTAIAIGLTSCEETNNNGPVVYYADFVSCRVQPNEPLSFEHILRNDQGSVMLYPNPSIEASVYNGQRILLQYYVNRTNDDNGLEITPLQLVPARHDTIIAATADTLAAYPNHPLRINTIWRTGSYINFDMALEYYNLPHRLDLFSNPEQAPGDTLDIILRHDRNGDAVGYWTAAYASFYIPNLASYKAVRVYANISNNMQENIVVNIQD